jgi:hypothetical protein
MVREQKTVGAFWNHVDRIDDYPPVGASDQIGEHGAHDL